MIMRALSLGLAMVAAFAVPARAAAPAPTPTDAEIRTLLADRVDGRRQGSGMVVEIVGPAGRRTIAYGTLARGDGRPMTGETVFQVASVTKVFTALLLAQAVESGALMVDGAVADSLPRPANRLPHAGDLAVTWADLATMTSGLPAWPRNRASRDHTNPFAGYSRGALFDFVASEPPVPRAQRRYAYSDLGYGLLGEALATREAVGWPALVEARVTGPLGLKDTRPELTLDMRAREAVEYDMTGGRSTRRDYGALAGAGALYSTADDLAVLLEALLGRREPSLAAGLQRMLATRRPGGQPPSTEAALGWNVVREGGRELIWKDGFYHAFIGLDRDAGVGVVVLANGQAPGGVNDLGLGLLDPGRAARPAPAAR